MTNLNDKQIELLKENWKDVKENYEKVVSVMYQLLEEKNSDFPLCDYESGACRFIRALDNTINNLTQLNDEQLVSDLKSLGYRHAQMYNTYDVMYPAMRNAWINAIDKSIGPISCETRDSWSLLWNKIASEMISGVGRR